MRLGTDSFLICNSSFLQPQTQKTTWGPQNTLPGGGAVAQSNEAAAAAQRARQASMAKLWEAAKTGDTDAISAMLDAGADPNDPEQAQQPVRPHPPLSCRALP